MYYCEIACASCGRKFEFTRENRGISMKNVPDHTGLFVTCSLPYQSGEFIWAVLKK